MEGAIRDLDRAVGISPRLTAAYNDRGIATTEQGRLDEAISDFDKTIETDSAYALAYLNRGMALLLKGETAEADKDFGRCLEINPSLKQLLEAHKKQVAQKHTAQP